jgi:hypothetical protein
MIGWGLSLYFFVYCLFVRLHIRFFDCRTGT